MNNFTYMKDRDFSEGRKYIGASDMPTLTGINAQYQTPFEFWQIFTGRKEGFKGNERTAAGHLMEPVILGKYVEKWAENRNIPAKTAMNDFISSRMFDDTRHGDFYSFTEAHPPENNRFTAHADLLDLSSEIPVIVQAKNTGMLAANTRKRNPFKGYASNDLSQDGVPLGVFFQEQWEMYCYGIPQAYVAVMIDGWNWRLYGPIKYKKKTVEKLVVLADRMLWHVDKDKPPNPKTWPDVIDMFPNIEKNTKSTVTGQDELDALEMRDQHARIAEKIRVLEARKLDINMALAGLAAEPDLGVMHNYLCTSDGTKIASFSEKSGRDFMSLSKLQELHPTEYEQYQEEGLITMSEPTRSIYISGAPAGTVDLWTMITEADGKKKKSRKKYTTAEKNDYKKFCKSVGLKAEWERYSV